ncbi:TetR/AcrR family transcriptional regulator [Actinomadura roseirufa]|uniref:TetR/AcrR family transcriptional regulator n=1 Tax=Actinomadura roseirufa TaxID=2094049 RepID=UPI0010418692|nr:TetR/AcrR family transcriptional regulator [Actinomadura roseirufa]
MTAGTRRRGADLETAIYDAVLAQLAEVGFRRLTMEGVAAAARTGKAALYRRWTSKEELVSDALRHALPDPPAAVSTGTVRTDLLAVLTILRDTLDACRGTAFRVLKEDRSEGGGLLHDVVRQRISEPVKAAIHEALARGAERGEVRPAAVTRQVANVGPAMIVYHNLTVGGEIRDEYLTSLVDEVLLPILRP